MNAEQKQHRDEIIATAVSLIASGADPRKVLAVAYMSGYVAGTLDMSKVSTNAVRRAFDAICRGDGAKVPL